MHREVKVSAKSALCTMKEKNRPTSFYCMKSQRPTQKMLEMQNVCLPTSLTRKTPVPRPIMLQDPIQPWQRHLIPLMLEKNKEKEKEMPWTQRMLTALGWSIMQWGINDREKEQADES